MVITQKNTPPTPLIRGELYRASFYNFERSRVYILINPDSLEELIITITDDSKICGIVDNEIQYKRYKYEPLLNEHSNL